MKKILLLCFIAVLASCSSDNSFEATTADKFPFEASIISQSDTLLGFKDYQLQFSIDEEIRNSTAEYTFSYNSSEFYLSDRSEKLDKNTQYSLSKLDNEKVDIIFLKTGLIWVNIDFKNKQGYSHTIKKSFEVTPNNTHIVLENNKFTKYQGETLEIPFAIKTDLPKGTKHFLRVSSNGLKFTLNDVPIVLDDAYHEISSTQDLVLKTTSNDLASTKVILYLKTELTEEIRQEIEVNYTIQPFDVKYHFFNKEDQEITSLVNHTNVTFQAINQNPDKQIKSITFSNDSGLFVLFDGKILEESHLFNSDKKFLITKNWNKIGRHKLTLTLEDHFGNKKIDEVYITQEVIPFQIPNFNASFFKTGKALPDGTQKFEQPFPIAIRSENDPIVSVTMEIVPQGLGYTWLNPLSIQTKTFNTHYVEFKVDSFTHGIIYYGNHNRDHKYKCIIKVSTQGGYIVTKEVQFFYRDIPKYN